MKRVLALLLVISAILTLTGCKKNPEPPLHTVTVYYKSAVTTYGTDEGVMLPYELDSTGHEDDLCYLLNAYVSAPVTDEYARTFPKTTKIVSLEQDGLTAKITLNDPFATLTGLNLSIACACLTRTAIALTGCQEVIISAENAKLDGHNFITLTSDSYLLLDESGKT